MSTYLLLRDNKQSGPYTLDEIKAKGFKKYDLVWVDGKSAAWRYPGELEEFKLFAPVVEEQPFDRFFKKPSQENQSKNISQTVKPKAEVVASASLPQVVVEVGNKKVYAVLPAKKATIVPAQETFSYQQINKEPIKREEPKPVLNDYSVIEKKAEVQPQESIKNSSERNVSTKNTNTYRRYMQPAILVACVMALLGGGIFIGWSIDKGNSNQGTKTDAAGKQVASINKPDAQNLSIPVSTTAPVEEKPAVIDQQKPAPVNKEVTNDNLAQQKTAETDRKPVTFTEKKKANLSKENSVLPSPKTVAKQETKTDSDSYVSVSHREATHRTDAINDKELIRNNISNLVSISSNKYHVGTFGGISEVQITVSNKSIYPLDLVTVEVQYVQANKKVFKTESVSFHNIRGGESMMLEAPESSRGIKIQYKVTFLNSKEASVSYSGT